MTKQSYRIPLTHRCEASYQKNFISSSLASFLYDDITRNFDLSYNTISLPDGTEHIMETGCYIFADPELTTFDKLPAVWGKRSPWTPALKQVRDSIEKVAGARFQVARCVFYKDGSEGVGFHQDLPAYGPTDIIASLSLGATREFTFRCLSSLEQISIPLEHASLLLMGRNCQTFYQHALLHDNNCRQARLNITFRQYA